MSPPDRKPFVETLREHAIVFDGAMGTALYERGLLYTKCLDGANVDNPDLVRSVHEEYVLAGADVIETNTFGANRYRLKTHGRVKDVEAINRAGAALAREAAGQQRYVAGSIGPTGLMLKTVEPQAYGEIQAAFVEQAAALTATDVDFLLLETFRQPEELELALRGVREGATRTLPVVATVSFDTFGEMADGTGPEAMAKRMVEWGADVIGVNCADGPAGVYEMATRLLEVGLPVIAQPNAGLPRRVEGRFAYMATPEYFQIYSRRLFKAGISAVGGCCGTTVEHIKKIASSARMADSARMEIGGGMREERDSVPPVVAPGVEVVPLEQKGLIGSKLGKDFLISVEVNPPPGLALDKALAGAEMLRDGGVDIINVADGPRASARMGNLALCARIQNELGMPALMHVTTRDRNILGLIAHLLAAHELGIKNLVVITGDPPKMGDFPDATAVYDTDSIGLLRLVQGLNRGYDPGGKSLNAATEFLLATGVEPAAKDYENEIRRFRLKVDAGAEMVMTQPVYDIEVLTRLLNDIEPLDIPVLIGLLPLASYRNAEFLHNEVPGMQIPEHIRDRMRKAGTGPSARAEGVAIAREMLAEVKDRVAGAYIMPPFGRYKLALDVIDGLVR